MATPAASAGGHERWSLRLFGGFELTTIPDGERVALPGKRERALLAYLLLSSKGRQPRRKLSMLLWGDAADETTLDNLRTCVWRLRKALEDHQHTVIISSGDEIAIDPTAVSVDVVAFCRLASQPDRDALEAAANLYGGELLDGLDIESNEFEAWRCNDATRYRHTIVDILSRLMTLSDAAGEFEQAAELGLRILTLDPFHEAAARKLMHLYNKGGRRGAAIKLYRDLAERLRREVGAQPEAETRAIFAEIMRDASSDNLMSTAGPMGLASSASAEPAQPVSHSIVSGAPRRRNGRTWAWIAVAGVATAVAILLLQLATPSGTTTERQNGLEQANIAASSALNAISVAVLPFTNLSNETTQEFFSDGVTEEITLALARIPNLRVVARSSAFQFKGHNRDIREIAEVLGATHLLEGSVRKEGSRVRITAHLVKANDNADIWSASYDRQVADIFAIQEDIARSIAAELRIPLQLEPGANLVANRNIDAESYEKLLLAKALFDGRAGSQFAHDEAETLLQEVIAKNPDYAPALALLGATYFMRAATLVLNVDEPVESVRTQVNALREKGEAAAQRSLQIDPRLSWGYATMGIITWSRAKPIETGELYTKALTIDPSDYYLLDGWAIRIGATGNVKEALVLLERARAVEPFQPVILVRMAQDLWLNGQDDAAIALAKTLRPVDRAPTLAMVYASMGRYAEAADEIMEIAKENQSAAEAARILRAAAAGDRRSPVLQPLPAELDFAYLYSGTPERALDLHERRADIGFLGGNQFAFVWHPSYALVRKTERFKTLVRKVGLVDYWRTKGWPESCHAIRGDDFECS